MKKAKPWISFIWKTNTKQKYSEIVRYREFRVYAYNCEKGLIFKKIKDDVTIFLKGKICSYEFVMIYFVCLYDPWQMQPLLFDFSYISYLSHRIIDSFPMIL